MKICIFGAGAMGSSFGARLLKFSPDAGEITFVTRNVARVQLLNREGMQVAGERYTVYACTPDELVGDFDLIVVATKQKENDAVAAFLADYLKDNGMLLTVQNGYPEPIFAGHIGADRVYGGVLSWGAEVQKDGEVLLTSTAGFHVGLGAYGKGERIAELARLLQPAFEITVTDLKELRFAKLSVNASFSTLSVISGLTFYEIAKKYKKYAVRLISEIFAVARAEGCKTLPLNGYDLFKVLTRCNGLLLPLAMKKYKQTRSGMLKDLASSRRSDIDFVAGAVLSEGERLGVETPHLRRAVSLVHDIENGLAEIASESLFLLD